MEFLNGHWPRRARGFLLRLQDQPGIIWERKGGLCLELGQRK